MRFAAVIILGFASFLNGSFDGRADVDLFDTLSDPNQGFKPVCCCSLQGLVEDHAIAAGATQTMLSLKGTADAYDVYLCLGPKSFVYVGAAAKDAAGNIAITGVNGQGALMAAWNGTNYDWKATKDGVEVGSGTMN